LAQIPHVSWFAAANFHNAWPGSTLEAVRTGAGDRKLRLVTELSENRIARARAGDRSAISALYADLSGGVVGYLRGSGARDPEDLAGDVFVAMIHGLHSFEGDENAFRRWVFTIAHNRLIDDRRKKSIRAVEAPIGGGRDIGADDSYDRVLGRVDAGPAVRALAQLTSDQRDAVVLRSVVGLSILDTAAILNKTPGAVKTLHRRALASLARVVGEQVGS
jgi:RNA polymerase sigma factor (sigma-70 family)